MLLFWAGLLAGLLLSILSVFSLQASRSVTAGGYPTNASPVIGGTSPGQFLLGGVAACSLVLTAFLSASSAGDAARSSFAQRGAAAVELATNVEEMDRDIQRIQKYLASTGGTAPEQRAPASQSQVGGLPDVETMISGLEKRLESEPGDVEGWKTLGWSYLNTGRPSEAVKAYEKAKEISPDRQDIADALNAAKAAASLRPE